MVFAVMVMVMVIVGTSIAVGTIIVSGKEINVDMEMEAHEHRPGNLFTTESIVPIVPCDFNQAAMSMRTGLAVSCSQPTPHKLSLPHVKTSFGRRSS